MAEGALMVTLATLSPVAPGLWKPDAGLRRLLPGLHSAGLIAAPHHLRQLLGAGLPRWSMYASCRSSQPGHSCLSKLRPDRVNRFAGQTFSSSRMELMCAGARARQVVKCRLLNHLLQGAGLTGRRISKRYGWRYVIHFLQEVPQGGSAAGRKQWVCLHAAPLAPSLKERGWAMVEEHEEAGHVGGVGGYSVPCGPLAVEARRWVAQTAAWVALSWPHSSSTQAGLHKWRFTFITYYYFTFFVWRVAEDRYAVTEGFFNDAALYDLHVREALAFIMWMSLEAPWGSQLPEGDGGALQALEAQLSQQAAKEVLRGWPKEHSKKYNEDPSEPSQVLDSLSWRSDSNRRQETPAAPLTPSKDQLASGAPVQDAPEYPLASLQLSSICLGAGQCGSVMQGWLWGVPVAVKGTDACKSPDTVELLWHEAQIYDFLKDLQGHHLPVLHGSGYWMGRNNFFLATSVVAGKPISNCTDVTVAQAVAQAARQALQAIHERGVAHGDVRADNFLDVTVASNDCSIMPCAGMRATLPHVLLQKLPVVYCAHATLPCPCNPCR
ncbi:protein kinase domain-containing protein [Haematococcus lacustris]|uniref:Protein kinase domain-containing protein n=1 Tax=Haematococcus lacustris TaxID=44745 RepID=A0A699YVP2_HAELA|nr:protein kinase domain-containing protein [Haematococcus lacustris]